MKHWRLGDFWLSSPNNRFLYYFYLFCILPPRKGVQAFKSPPGQLGMSQRNSLILPLVRCVGDWHYRAGVTRDIKNSKTAVGGLSSFCKFPETEGEKEKKIPPPKKKLITEYFGKM